MKKTLIIILILAVTMIPAAVFSHDTSTALEIYTAADTSLSNYINDYAELIENRNDAIEQYENRRIFARTPFSLAQALSSKENGLLQIDYNIFNKYDSIKAREAFLEVEFRTSFANLYSFEKAVVDAKKQAADTYSEYIQSKQNSTSGFISKNALMELEYDSLSDSNNALIKQRQFESALRAFNYKMDLPLDYDDYTFNFDEEIDSIQPLDIYMQSALSNSSSVKLIRQKLEKYYVEQRNFDVYSLISGWSSITDPLKMLSINIQLQELTLAKTKASLSESIIIKYSALEIEREKLGLAELNINILEQKYQTDKSLYNRGYMDKDELSESLDVLNDEKNSYKIKIYKYNTQIKSLERDCAYYAEESDNQ